MRRQRELRKIPWYLLAEVRLSLRTKAAPIGDPSFLHFQVGKIQFIRACHDRLTFAAAGACQTLTPRLEGEIAIRAVLPARNPLDHQREGFERGALDQALKPEAEGLRFHSG